MGVPESELQGRSAYQSERKLGLSNEEKRAEYVRQHDWFYRGTVGTTPGRRGDEDTPDMARDYVRGFLYKGRQTPARRAARDRFVSRMGGPGYVDWTVWRDYRLGPDTNVAILDEAPEEWEIYEED